MCASSSPACSSHCVVPVGDAPEGDDGADRCDTRRIKFRAATAVTLIGLVCLGLAAQEMPSSQPAAAAELELARRLEDAEGDAASGSGSGEAEAPEPPQAPPPSAPDPPVIEPDSPAPPYAPPASPSRSESRGHLTVGIVAACLVVLGPAAFAVGIFVLRHSNRLRDPTLIEREAERKSKAKVKGLKKAASMAPARGVGTLEGKSRI